MPTIGWFEILIVVGIAIETIIKISNQPICGIYYSLLLES